MEEIQCHISANSTVLLNTIHQFKKNLQCKALEKCSKNPLTIPSSLMAFPLDNYLENYITSLSLELQFAYTMYYSRRKLEISYRS